MPYEVDSPLATAFGAASGFMQGQADAKKQKRADEIAAVKAQRDADSDALNARYTQALIEKAKSEADARAPVNFSGTPTAEGFGKMGVRQQYGVLVNEAQQAASAGNPTEAQRLTTLANALITNEYTSGAKTNATNAGTGLTQAKTVTEKQRPALIQAQTRNTNDLPKSRADALQERYWATKTQAETSLQRGRMAESAALTRQANSIAAAWDRMQFHESHADGRARTAAQTKDDTTNPESEYEKLSPNGKKFYDMLAGTNNPATPAQSVSALHRADNIPMADKVVLGRMFAQKTAPVVTSKEQTSLNKPAKTKANPAAGLEALPAPVQDVIIKQRKLGVNDGAVLKLILGSKLPDDVKQSATRALSGS